MRALRPLARRVARPRPRPPREGRRGDGEVAQAGLPTAVAIDDEAAIDETAGFEVDEVGVEGDGEA